MFGNWMRNREKERAALRRFLENRDHMRCIDLRNTMMLGEMYDQRPYVGAVGLFSEGTIDNLDDSAWYYTNDEGICPDLIWFCRSDGNIWAEWNIRIPYESDEWKEENRRRNRFTNRDMIEKIPMSPNSKITVNKFTQELWTMHKLGSYSLL